MDKKFLFIINPIRSKLLKKTIEDYIINSNLFLDQDYDIKYSEYAGHSYYITKENINNYNFFIAVGGDGTVNEVSKALVNTVKTFGIIPIGSGNGLANYLNIPRDIYKSLAKIKQKNIIKIDSCIINDKHFINLSGTGFDAYIAHQFEKTKTRGFENYILETIKAIFNYKSFNYSIIINNTEFTEKALFISFANSNQFGNNAIINPNAIINDGHLELIICKPFPFYAAPALVYRLFRKNINKSKYIKIIKCPELIVKNNKKIFVHIDGEPGYINNDIKVEINPKSIKVII